MTDLLISLTYLFMHGIGNSLQGCLTIQVLIPGVDYLMANPCSALLLTASDILLQDKSLFW